MNRRTKVKATPLGDKLRTYARAYAATGQDERAGGLEQAADTVDRDTYLSRLRARSLVVEDDVGRLRPSPHVVPAAAS